MGKAAIGAAAEAAEPLRPLPATVRAAQYVRMSREHQKYSIANQATANQLYAAQHGMAVVRTYSDEGRSGLSLNRRDALKRLIADVQTGKIDFNAIIVYDVSRWGRFQDADESAYYEFICKHAGITVHYCAEQFQNDGSSLSAIVKAVKRAMAGEYSRELSVRVFAAQCRIVQQGYRLGGYAGYGLRRMLVGQNGALRGVLERGEHKCIATDRLILVPGPQNEVTTVRWIFATFVQDGKTEQQIASILNERGTMSEFGRPWTAERIRYMLKSEKYAGHNVWGHISFKLQKTKVHNAPELWVRASRVFEPIIEQSTFDAAQAVFQDRLIHPIRGRGRKYSDKMMLAALKRLCKRKGYLSRRIIDLDSKVQSAGAYANRFGSLKRTYQLIGFKPCKYRKKRRIRPTRHSINFSDAEMLKALRRVLRKHGTLTSSIIEEDGTIPCASAYRLRFGSIGNAYRLIGFTPLSLARRWRRPKRPSRDEMLDTLRRLLVTHGHLSRSVINNADNAPSTYCYCKRFGSILKAYDLIGYACANGRDRVRNPAAWPGNTHSRFNTAP
jgi:DNA invertase Pin-like site-specific DNA recombinase